MNAYAALLRGINVSGKTMIKMAALTQSLEKAGYKGVKTYIQSGNVVFRTEEADTVSIGKNITELIASDFDAKVPAMVRTKKRLQAVIRENPFTEAEGAPKVYVIFLDKVADDKLAAKIDPEKFQPEQFSIAGDHIYLFCPDGYGKAKLNNNFFESKLKQNATTRNLATINHLIDMLDILEGNNHSATT